MGHQAYHSKNLVHGAGNSGISPGINTLSWSNLSNMTASEGGPRADGMEFGVGRNKRAVSQAWPAKGFLQGTAEREGWGRGASQRGEQLW